MHIHLSTVDSTNNVVKAMLRDYSSVIVTADEQTAGRGRNGKEWVGDANANVYASFGTRHTQQPTQDYLVAAMAYPSLAVYALLRTLDDSIQIRLKYPNDIQVNTQDGWAKIAGVLIEHEFVGSRCTATTIGVGINVRQLAFPATITQLCTSLLAQGIDVSVAEVRNSLLAWVNHFSQQPHSDVLQEWWSALHIEDKEIEVRGSSDIWKLERLMDDGRLLVRSITTLEERIIDNGDTIRYND